MKRVNIAFDIDGTLRCNGGKTAHRAGIELKCNDTCQEANQRIVSLVHILSTFKNVHLYAWSGGGKDYAWQFVRTHGLGKMITESRCFSKMDKSIPKIDIAIDDQHEFSLGGVNLIVWEK